MLEGASHLGLHYVGRYVRSVEQRLASFGKKIRKAQEGRHCVQALSFCSRKEQKLKQKTGRQNGRNSD